MINIMKTSGHEAYNLKQFVLDTEDDLKDLPTAHITVGSSALVIATSNVYMLNSKGQWIEIAGGSGGGGGTGSAVLTEALDSQVAIGIVAVGTHYAAGTSLEQIIRDMLTSNAAPKISILKPDANHRLYDAVEDSLDSVEVQVKVTKTSNDISSLSFYIGGTLVDTITEGVKDGGTFTKVITPDDPFTSTFTIKATVKDSKDNTVSTSAEILFVGKTYYGSLDDGVEINEENIKTLETKLKKTKTWSDEFTCYYGKVIYAYPKSFGALTSIKNNGFECMNDSFTRTEIEIDGIDYYCYYLTESAGYEDSVLDFT